MAKKRKVKKSVSRKRKPAKKRVRTVARKRAPASHKHKVKSRVRKRVARKRAPGKRHTVRQLQRTSIVKVVSGVKRRRTRRVQHRPHRMAGSRRRSVSGKGGSNTLLLLGAAALAFYVWNKSKTPTYYPNTAGLPPLSQTSNYLRNDQSNTIVQYALAAGLAVDAITKLIDRLNASDDNDIKNIYDHVTTTGDVGVYV